MVYDYVVWLLIYWCTDLTYVSLLTTVFGHVVSLVVDFVSWASYILLLPFCAEYVSRGYFHCIAVSATFYLSPLHFLYILHLSAS